MISPAQQQLDEALTGAGHADTCPAFEGHRCPGYPACTGNPVDEALYQAVGADRAAEQAKRPRMVSEVRPTSTVIDATGDGREAAIRREVAQALPGSVMLIGPKASAFLRYEAAASRLRVLDVEYKAAQREYQEAHQAFADAVAGV